MKKIQELGKKLSKNELKNVIGGYYGCITYGDPCLINLDKCCAGDCIQFTGQEGAFGSCL